MKISFTRRLAAGFVGVSILIALSGPMASFAQTVPPATQTTTTTFNTGPHVDITASPTSDLTDGTTISVAAYSYSSVLRELSAQICQGALCATIPPTSAADAFVRVPAAASPTQSLSLPFRVGIGTFGTSSGETFVCDARNPCRLHALADTNIPQGVGLHAHLRHHRAGHDDDHDHDEHDQRPVHGAQPDPGVALGAARAAVPDHLLSHLKHR
jgi:hypothetical protein